MASFLTDSWDDIQKFFGLNGQTTANTAGMNPGQAKAVSSAATLGNAGLLTTVFGGITSAIGSFYAAKSQQYQAQSQASSYDFQANMDAINAREAELSAQSIMESGKDQVEKYTMRAGQEQASQTVSTAARGVDLSSGSAVLSRASNDLVKQMDVLTINSNATRAAWSQRTQATNYENEGLLARTSAANARATAGSISPFLAGGTSLLNTATGVASQWDWRRKLALSTAGGS